MKAAFPIAVRVLVQHFGGNGLELNPCGQPIWVLTRFRCVLPKCIKEGGGGGSHDRVDHIDWIM